MTSIVGLVAGKDIWIGGDSRASSEEGDIRPIITKKIFRKGPYLFGYSGSIRGGQVLQNAVFKPPRNIYSLPDELRKISEKKGCLSCTQDGQMQYVNCIIVAYNGKLYEILSDFQINEVAEFSVVGSGTPYAYGSLFTTKDLNYEPQLRIKIALDAASFFDSHTAPPYVIEKL